MLLPPQVDGRSYLLREIYGIERKTRDQSLENDDDEDEDEDIECVVGVPGCEQDPCAILTCADARCACPSRWTQWFCRAGICAFATAAPTFCATRRVELILLPPSLALLLLLPSLLTVGAG